MTKFAKKMKAKEMMLGDWVLEKSSGKPVQVTLEIMGAGIIYPNEHFKPIPLTEEILIKSGLESEQDGYYEVHLLFEEESGGLVVYKRQQGVFVLYAEYRDEEFIDKYWTIEATKLELRYVHELQHVLRLWGIAKEIVL